MSDNDTATITVPVEIEFGGDEDVHASAWEYFVASVVDEETAREQLGAMIGEMTDTDAAVYECFRQAKQQREQAMRGMQAQLATATDGGGDGQEDDGE